MRLGSLLLLCACGSSSPAPTATTPREVVPAGPPLTFSCTAPKATLELSNITLLEAVEPGHRDERRWNAIEAEFRLKAGDVEHAGKIKGVRDADHAFLQLQALTPDNAMEAVHLVVPRPDGAAAQLRWSTGVGESMEDSDVATCQGSLTTATPAKR